jgi:hypothetical protein
MAARPDCELSHAEKRPKKVAAGQTVVRGRVVKLINADDECQHSGAGEAGDGVAIEGGTAGQIVTIVLLAGACVVPVKVGTGGATRGLAAVVVADGVTNSGTLGGGAVLKNIVGHFTQSGVAGDEVGMVPLRSASVSA